MGHKGTQPRIVIRAVKNTLIVLAADVQMIKDKIKLNELAIDRIHSDNRLLKAEQGQSKGRARFW